jgi:tetratricopeptide (TPR) repeat protein
LIGDIQQFISQKYPGVVLDSPVQGWWYLDEYKKGIEAYKKIKNPTAEDERWIGACHFLLLNDQVAAKHHHQAIQNSSIAAHINLAHSFMFTQNMDDVLPELSKVDFEALKTTDKIYYLRVKSYYEEQQYNLGRAVKDLETAKELAENIAEKTLWMPILLRASGAIGGRIGKSKYALECHEESLQICSSNRKEVAFLDYIGTLITLGHHAEAERKLKQIQLKSTQDFWHTTFYLHSGTIAWISHKFPEARITYENLIHTAAKYNLICEEFMARVALVSLNLIDNLPVLAKEHLRAAKPLISDKSDKLAYQFQEILLDDFEKTNSAEESYSALEKLSQSYQDMGYIQEQHWCKLHMADIKRRQGLDILPDLHELQAAAETMQNFKFLTREWTLTKDLHTIARYTHPRLAGVEPITVSTHTETKVETQAEVELSFLGRRSVSLNGKHLDIPQKWCEVLMLLALHRDGLSGEELLAGIYGDAGSMATLKAMLSKMRDVLPIGSRPYKLNARIEADFIAIETLLSQGKSEEALQLYRGRLLPTSEAPGIVDMRDYLDELLRQAVMLSGTETLEISQAFTDDLTVWEGFLQKLSVTDTRYPFVKAKVRRIRHTWGLPISGDN